MKRLLLMGCFNQDYPRNAALNKALALNFDVRQIHLSEKSRFLNLRLFFGFLRNRRDADTILFLWPVHRCLPVIALLRLLTRKTVVLDLFWSPYETYVLDRALAGKRSIKARWYWLQDWLAGLLGNILIFDTMGREKFFRDAFGVAPDKKTVILPVTIDTGLIANLDVGDILKIGPTIDVLFYGSFIPLQGIEYILKAAKLLEPDQRFRFTLIGHGQTKPQMVSLATSLGLKNVEFMDKMPYPDLIRRIKQSDICLGIFSPGEKAMRVIPNKVLDCMACCKPVVTAQNQDLTDHFSDGRDLVFCQAGDAHSLADAIRQVAEHPEAARDMGRQAQEAVVRDFSITAVSDKIAALNL